jgi:hypothetical protein
MVDYIAPIKSLMELATGIGKEALLQAAAREQLETSVREISDHAEKGVLPIREAIQAGRSLDAIGKKMHAEGRGWFPTTDFYRDIGAFLISLREKLGTEGMSDIDQGTVDIPWLLHREWADTTSWANKELFGICVQHCKWLSSAV